MVDLTLGLILIELAVIVFVAWVVMAKQIEIEEVHARFDEMEQALTVVAGVLDRLGDVVPQFHLNQNPFAPILEALAAKMSGAAPSNPDTLLRDDNGRFRDGETESETIETPPI